MTETPTTKPAVGSAKPQPADIRSLNLWQKLAAITGDIGSIAKDGDNKEQHYKFISYGAVAASLRTLFGKYGVVCIPDMGERTEREFTSKNGAKGVAVTIEFKFTFKNADKPEETEVVNWVGEAADYGDKGTNKAATAALKYCLMRTFNVSEQGDDPDEATIDRGKGSVEPLQPKRPSVADALKKAGGVLTYKGFTDADERKAVVLKIAGVATANDLTADKLDHVMEVLGATTGDELRSYLAADKGEEATA